MDDAPTAQGLAVELNQVRLGIAALHAQLEDGAVGRLSDEGVASLQRVRAAAQTLAQRLDDISGLSRVSRREFLRQTIDLSALAQEIGDEPAAEPLALGAPVRGARTLGRGRGRSRATFFFTLPDEACAG